MGWKAGSTKEGRWITQVFELPEIQFVWNIEHVKGSNDQREDSDCGQILNGLKRHGKEGWSQGKRLNKN